MSRELEEKMNSLIQWLLNKQARERELMILLKTSQGKNIFLVGPVNDAVASLVTAQLLF